jgi:hypothetical protein
MPGTGGRGGRGRIRIDRIRPAHHTGNVRRRAVVTGVEVRLSPESRYGQGWSALASDADLPVHRRSFYSFKESPEPISFMPALACQPLLPPIPS